MKHAVQVYRSGTGLSIRCSGCPTWSTHRPSGQTLVELALIEQDHEREQAALEDLARERVALEHERWTKRLSAAQA